MQCKWYGCKSGTGNSGFYTLGHPWKCINWSPVLNISQITDFLMITQRRINLKSEKKKINFDISKL